MLNNSLINYDYAAFWEVLRICKDLLKKTIKILDLSFLKCIMEDLSSIIHFYLKFSDDNDVMEIENSYYS